MSEEEKQELDKKLEQLFGEGDEISQSQPTRGAMCYCPAPPRGRRKKRDFLDDQLADLFDDIFADDNKEEKNTELSLPSPTEKKSKSILKRLFSHKKK